jgi:hypothetical protein
MLQFLLERRAAGLRFRIVRGEIYEEADPSHPPRLLRAERQGPRGRRTAEQPYELAASHHSITSLAQKAKKGAANKFLATITNDPADLNLHVRSQAEAGAGVAPAV